MKTKYNVIGDIHGRTVWEKLVDPTRINIFLGDYFDPYDSYTFEHLKENFLNIIQFAKTNPGTILLLGNHDLHYIHKKDFSRYDDEHEEDILKLFLDNMHLFQGIAYNIDNRICVSHAGFTKEWCEYSGMIGDMTIENAVNHANALFWDGYVECSNGDRYWDEPNKHGMREFTFQAHMKFSDYYGTSPGQSPVWIRPQTLLGCSAFPEFDQVVGHTQGYHIMPDAVDINFTTINWSRKEEEEIIHKGRLIGCDVLGQNAESLFIDVESDNIIYTVNKLNQNE